MGYAKRIIQAMVERNEEEPARTINVCYAPASRIKFLKNMLGYVCQWPVSIYDLSVSRSLEKLQSYPGPFQLNDIDENNMHDVLLCEKVFGYTRENFLKTWLNTPGSHTRVAFNKEGRILVNVVVKLAFFYEEG